MERGSLSIGPTKYLMLLCLLQSSLSIKGDDQVDALHLFRQGVEDPSQVLSTWDPAIDSACSWEHITCDIDNKVIRIGLGNSLLSGPISPSLGNLSNLQYLELHSNNLSGVIPDSFGQLQNLVVLGLYQNVLAGSIPSTLGNLQMLRNLRLQNNSLSGSIPMSLTNIPGLQVLDLSHNHLSGEVPSNGSFSLFTPISFLGNPDLCGIMVNKQCPGGPALPPQYYSPCLGGDCEIAPATSPANEGCALPTTWSLLLKAFVAVLLTAVTIW